MTSATYLEIAAALGIAVDDGRRLTTMLIQGAKRVSDGDYQAAAADIRAIRALLTPPRRQPSALRGRSQPRNTDRTGSRRAP